MTKQLNEEAIDAQSEAWQRYLELLKERRGEKWYEIAKAEGPPNFEEGLVVMVHSTEAHFEFKVAQINEKNGKFMLRPTDKFTNPAARYREHEVVLIKGVEFEVKRVDRNKLIATPMPPKDLERPDLYQAGVTNAATGKLFMIIVGETEEQFRENVSLMNRVFDVIRSAADESAGIENVELQNEAVDLAEALGLPELTPELANTEEMDAGPAE